MNCIIVDDDKLYLKVIEEFVSRTEILNLVDSFENAVDAINSFNSESDIDLIFLDIEMPEMSGIDFLETLKNPPQIIIISSKERYALNAFEHNVTDYLLKPTNYGRFFKAVDKAFDRFKKHKIDSKDEEIFIKKNASFIRLRYDEILWVEALENYVIFNTFNEKHTVHFTMKAIEKKLPVGKFTRVHRSYIINTSSIKVIEDNTVVVSTSEGNKSIPIGKSYKDKLMGDLNLMQR